MTETNQPPRPEHRPNDALDSITIAAFDVDTRIFRTMWHSITRTSDVAFAALKADYSCYLSPIRVFIALFSFQFIVGALFGVPITITLDSLIQPLIDAGEGDRVEAWLAGARASDGSQPSLMEIEQKLESWQSMAVWPLTFLASLPYLLLLKAYRPGIPFWGHLQVYLIPTNGSYVIMVAALGAFAVGDLLDSDMMSMVLFMIGMVGAMVLYFVLMGRLVVRYYSRTRLGAAIRLAVLILILPVSMIITSAGHFGFAYWTLDSQYGLNVFEILAPSPETPSESEGETE